MKNYLVRHAVSAFLLLGVALVVYRLLFGLGAVSNLSDSQPWGLIKALNILTFAALTAGSFAVASLVYIFGLKRLTLVVRPALLMGFVGHTFVLAALLYDVGRPAQIWRILIDPQITSVMLLTFACEAVYSIAMICEVIPEFVAAKSFKRINKLLDFIKVPVVVLSATVAIIYQGTLGALYLVSPHRVLPLWWSPILPVLFLVSAVAAGLGMVIIEAYLSDRAGRRRLNSAIMAELGGIAAIFVWVYLILRVADLVFRGGISAIGMGGFKTVWFGTEMVAGFVLPAVMLSIRAVRESPGRLAAASGLVSTGVIMNRLGVAITGWTNFIGVRYIPSAIETYVSLFFIFAAITVYSYASGALERRISMGSEELQSSVHPAVKM